MFSEPGRLFCPVSVSDFLLDPGVPRVWSLGPDVRPSVTERPFADLTDVPLADEDTNSILTDNANRAIQDNVAMQWCNLVANFANNANGATWWPNFEPMQVVPSVGQIFY